MIWKAIMKDGSIIDQYSSGKLTYVSELDKEKIERLILTETSGDTAVQFSADNGVIKFTNFDYMKLCELSGGEQLNFVYNKDTESFKLDDKSMELTKGLVLQDDKYYFSMEFDSRGYMYVGGQLFYMGFILNDKDMPFVEQPPYNDFKIDIAKNEDFFMNSGAPVKKSDYVTSYTLTLHRKHEFEDLTFDVTYNLIYDLFRNCVLIDYNMICNQTVSGVMYSKLGDTRIANPAQFYAGETKQVKTVLTLL